MREPRTVRASPAREKCARSHVYLLECQRRPPAPIKPNQAVWNRRPGNPVSIMVGRSGAPTHSGAPKSRRADAACRRARTAAPRKCCRMPSSPPCDQVGHHRRDAAVGHMWMFEAAIVLNSSPARCCEVPTPADPKLSLPGFWRAYATSSCTLRTGTSDARPIVVRCRRPA